MPQPVAYSLQLPVAVIDTLYDLADNSARAAAKTLRSSRPRRRLGQTLRPGSATPLWNELVRQITPHLKIYGSKAKLARILGLPRQRMQDALKSRAACLDAERTLLLLCWLGRKQQGRELGGPPGPEQGVT